MGFRGGLLPLVYVVVGAFVAASDDYFDRVESLKGVGSALLAIFLWPLVLLGIDLNIR